MKKWICFLATLLLAGCATTGNYERILQSWMGNDVNGLIEAWGPPSSTFDMPNGNKTYTWLNVNGSTGYANYNPYTRSAYAMSTTWWCKTTFTSEPSGRLISWHWEGNACRSKYSPRNAEDNMTDNKSQSTSIPPIQIDALGNECVPSVMRNKVCPHP